MTFANTYFKRFQANDPKIKEKPSKELFLTVVIPAYDEPDLIRSLESLNDCNMPDRDVEIIIVINSSENTPEDILHTNQKCLRDAQCFSDDFSNERMKFLVMNIENLPEKFAGVGLARKTGMDEALHRYNLLNKPEGLIAGFDADSLVEKNYFIEIEKYFKNYPKTEACSVHFEHPVDSSEFYKEFNEDIYKNIINYELHLRYFKEAIKYTGSPFAFHTVGSSFVVRADVYAMEGGMNRKKAGEDFYFLQKIIQRGKYGEINNTKVIPSPRISDRVPFGTGAALKKMTRDNVNEFYTYNFEVFKILKVFFLNIDSLFEKFDPQEINDYILEFLKINKFEADYNNIMKNSPNLITFKKRFYDWFNGFRLIKFVNYVHENDFSKAEVIIESTNLLQTLHPEIHLPVSEIEMLNLYRKQQIGLL